MLFILPLRVLNIGVSGAADAGGEMYFFRSTGGEWKFFGSVIRGMLPRCYRWVIVISSLINAVIHSLLRQFFLVLHRLLASYSWVLRLPFPFFAQLILTLRCIDPPSLQTISISPSGTTRGKSATRRFSSKHCTSYPSSSALTHAGNHLAAGAFFFFFPVCSFQPIPGL